MIDINRTSEIMLEVAEKFGYDIEDDSDLRLINRIMLDEPQEKTEQLFFEDLVACRNHVHQDVVKK